MDCCWPIRWPGDEYGPIRSPCDEYGPIRRPYDKYGRPIRMPWEVY